MVRCRSPGRWDRLRRARVPSRLLGMETERKSELTELALGELLRILRKQAIHRTYENTF